MISFGLEGPRVINWAEKLSRNSQEPLLLTNGIGLSATTCHCNRADKS